MHGLQAGFYVGFGIGMGVWALVMAMGEERIQRMEAAADKWIEELARKTWRRLVERR
jgi:hypothetical protein